MLYVVRGGSASLTSSGLPANNSVQFPLGSHSGPEVTNSIPLFLKKKKKISFRLCCNVSFKFDGRYCILMLYFPFHVMVFIFII